MPGIRWDEADPLVTQRIDAVERQGEALKIGGKILVLWKPVKIVGDLGVKISQWFLPLGTN